MYTGKTRIENLQEPPIQVYGYKIIKPEALVWLRASKPSWWERNKNKIAELFIVLLFGALFLSIAIKYGTVE